MTTRGTILLLTTPGKGHGFPMIQLGRVLQRHSLKNPGLIQCQSVVVWPCVVGEQKKLAASVGNEDVSVEFVERGSNFAEAFRWSLECGDECLDDVHNILFEHGGIPPVLIIVDMFVWLVPGLRERYPDVPIWEYCPSPYTFLYFRQEYMFERPESPIEIPGYGDSLKIFPTDLPSATSAIFKLLIERCKEACKLVDGVLINDSSEMYPQELIKAIKATAFPVGPLALFDNRLESAGDPEIALWLNTAPPRSVIYVAMGSWCPMAEKDMWNLAKGLQKTGLRVLWALRKTVPNGKLAQSFMPEKSMGGEVDEDYRLPIGFREEVDPERFLITDWVNQLQVLQHPSVATFVSHCGWNSTLECLTVGEGVSMVGLPLGADQIVTARWLDSAIQVGKLAWNGPEVEDLDADKFSELVLEVYGADDLRENALRVRKVLRKTDQSESNLTRLFDIIAS